jgi:hypothetical protein
MTNNTLKKKKKKKKSVHTKLTFRDWAPYCAYRYFPQDTPNANHNRLSQFIEYLDFAFWVHLKHLNFAAGIFVFNTH